MKSNMLLRVLAVAIALMALCAVVQAETMSVEMVHAELVDDLSSALSPSALVETQSASSLDSDAEADVEAEADAEAEATVDAAAEAEAEMEAQAKEEDYAITKCGKKIIWEKNREPNPEASLMETETAAEAESEVSAESEAALDAQAEADAEQEAEADAEAAVDAQDEAAADAEMLADAEAEVEGEMEAEAAVEEDVALLEVSAAPAPAPAPAAKKPPPKVHVHVATKVHGGPNADNLLRVEERFDSLHDRVMGRLNRLMSRIQRHPDTIEDKTAAYDFKA